MTTELARRFRVDVSTDSTSWVQVNGINDFNPQVTNSTQDASAYDSDGWESKEITMKGWKWTIKALVRSTAGVLDPGLELCRATELAFGDTARLYVRAYDRTTGKQARTGRAIVSFTRSKTGIADLDEAQVEFDGDGALAPLADVAVTVPAPVVLSATPSAAAAGAQVTITGANFVGVLATTGVKFGAVNATSWTVVSANTIVAIVPAGTAGAANITVTNATGASAAFPYTRGA